MDPGISRSDSQKHRNSRAKDRQPASQPPADHARSSCCCCCCCLLNIPGLCTPVFCLFVCLFVLFCFVLFCFVLFFRGRNCWDNFTCCHTRAEAADLTSFLPQWQYTDTGSTANPCRFCCLMTAQRPSNMPVCLRDGSAPTILRAATLRRKMQTKLSISPSHSILTPGQPVPALTL